MDEILNDEVIKEIPVVKSVVGLLKLGTTVSNAFFVKKLLIFIQQFTNGDSDNESVRKFKEKLKGDRFAKKAMDHCIILIERHLETDKTKILANLFRAWVDDKIKYEEFTTLSIWLDSLHPKVYLYFKKMEEFDFKIDHKVKGQERNFYAESLLVSTGMATAPSDFWHGFQLSKEGIQLYYYGIKPTQESNGT